MRQLLKMGTESEQHFELKRIASEWIKTNFKNCETHYEYPVTKFLGRRFVEKDICLFWAHTPLKTPNPLAYIKKYFSFRRYIESVKEGRYGKIPKPIRSRLNESFIKKRLKIEHSNITHMIPYNFYLKLKKILEENDFPTKIKEEILDRIKPKTSYNVYVNLPLLENCSESLRVDVFDCKNGVVIECGGADKERLKTLLKFEQVKHVFRLNFKRILYKIENDKVIKIGKI